MKKFLIALLVIIALGCTAGTIFFAVKYNEVKGEKENLVAQNATLQMTVDSIGPITTAWTVKEGLDIEPGDEVLDEHLVQITVPANSVNANWVLNKSELVGKFYKVHIEAGTSFTYDLLMETDSVEDYAYERDVKLASLPVGLEVGDYISFRFVLPYGEEWIVFEKKRVKEIREQTIKIDMSETELNIWTSIVRDMGLYTRHGASVYIVKYNEPGVMDETIPFYPIREDMYPIVTLNPNIPDKTRLINEELRKYIDYKLELARTEEYQSDSGNIKSEVDAEHQAIQSDYRTWLESQQEQGQVVTDTTESSGSGNEQNSDQQVNDEANSIDQNIGDMMYKDEDTID